MKQNVKRVEEVISRICQVKSGIDEAKKLYEELDELTLELIELVENYSLLKTSDGRYLQIVDNYAEKNTVFRPVGVKRYETSILTQEELDKKMAKDLKKSLKD